MKQFTIEDKGTELVIVFRELRAFDVYLLVQEILIACFGQGANINGSFFLSENSMFQILQNVLNYLGTQDKNEIKNFYNRLFQGHYLLLDGEETALTVDVLDLTLKNSANLIKIAIECGKNHFADFFTTLLGTSLDEIR